MPIIVTAGHVKILLQQREKKISFSMAIGKVELRHECFPKHLHIGRARMKEDNETDDEGKRGVSMERRKAGTKERSPDGQ